MALRTTLGQAVEMLRDECGISSASSRGNDNLAYLQRLIKRYYETLVDDFDWAFLRVGDEEATKILEAGERYYDFPVEMDIEKTINAYIFYGNVWVPMIYGIEPTDYNSMNPELNQRADPAIKWRIRNESQFEVWPLPASTGAYVADGPAQTISGPLVRFTGRRRAERLTGNDSRMDMDDQVVVLYCAAEVLAKQGQKDAEAKLAAANKRLATLRAGYSDRRKVRIGMGENPADQRGWPRIRAFPASV